MLQIKTTKLQEMLSRAIKGAGNNKLLPITELLTLELKDSKFTITTTDNTNYLYVTENIQGDDFYVCVGIDKFPKLIARMTCENVSLDLKDNYLEVKGNGTYQIDIQLDENGSMVQFPNPLSEIKLDNQIGTLSLAKVKSILTAIRPALATSVALPQYMNYYVGDAVTATDTYKISSMATKIFETPRLISAETMDLLDTMIDDNINIYADDNRLIFQAEHGTLFGYTADGIQSYGIAAIMNYINKDYPSNCKISKVDIIQLLDRISLFVDYLDNDVIGFRFEEDGIAITSKKLSGSEKIPYISCNNFVPCNGEVILSRLYTQIKAQSGDVIEMHFGDEKSIKMKDGDSTLIVALGAEE